MRAVRLWILVPLAVALASGCSSTSKPTIVACENGDRSDCTGPNDCQGTRTCEDEQWGDCVCDSDTGSSGGSSGAGTTGSGNSGGDTNSSGSGNTASNSGGTGGDSSGGTAGSGGETETSTGGSGGSGGSADTGGTGGTGGSGGGTSGGGNGGSGGSTVCPVDDTRCGQAGRERCDGDGWVSAPCPLETPACEQGECVLRGPSMVQVSTFYIDSTEVTVAQYREFLDYKGNDTSGQIAECEWNSSYWDDERPFEADNWPINYVDWCDAHEFCDWAGKRLCGRIGGGPITDDDFFEPTQSEWLLACGGPDGSSHVNGNPDCNTNGGFEYLVPVGSMAGCEGHYEGLFDMEGNVYEWTNNCEGANQDATDVCRLAGGSYIQNFAYCTNVLAEYARDTQAGTFGFRCCND